MIKWMSKIEWGKVLLAGALYTVVATVVHSVESMVTLNYYMDPRYLGVWSKIMMPNVGPPPPEFMIMSLIFSLTTGVSIALIYYYLKDILPKQIPGRIFMFADLLVATSFIFFSLPTYLLFNVPMGLLGSWFISSFVILLSASWMIVKIVGK
jgi:hypothetical protein